MNPKLQRVYLARHGETLWTTTGQHTGRTDIPLTERGEQNARRLGERLGKISFTAVLTSPLIRAKRTCELAGFGAVARSDPDLMEWNYGDYEGKRSADIRLTRTSWYLFRDGCPGGENAEQVGVRADRVIARLRQQSGNMLLFSHGHFLRVFTARWIGLAAADAELFFLSTAGLSIMSYEHQCLEEPVIELWNETRHVE